MKGDIYQQLLYINSDAWLVKQTEGRWLHSQYIKNKTNVWTLKRFEA